MLYTYVLGIHNIFIIMYIWVWNKLDWYTSWFMLNTQIIYIQEIFLKSRVAHKFLIKLLIRIIKWNFTTYQLYYGVGCWYTFSGCRLTTAVTVCDELYINTWAGIQLVRERFWERTVYVGVVLLRPNISLKLYFKYTWNKNTFVHVWGNNFDITIIILLKYKWIILEDRRYNSYQTMIALSDERALKIKVALFFFKSFKSVSFTHCYQQVLTFGRICMSYHNMIYW